MLKAWRVDSTRASMNCRTRAGYRTTALRLNSNARLTSVIACVTLIPRGQAMVQLNVVRQLSLIHI